MDNKSVVSERWVSIMGYEGMYEVSDQGNVRSLDRVITQKHPRSLDGPGIKDAYQKGNTSRFNPCPFREPRS